MYVLCVVVVAVVVVVASEWHYDFLCLPTMVKMPFHGALAN